MFKSVSVKLLVFNIVVALIGLVGYLFHITSDASFAVKLIFYPIYGYVMLSFVTSAVGIVWGVLERQKGIEAGRIGVIGHSVYIAVVLAALLVIWKIHH